jgi:hypothetical protein
MKKSLALFLILAVSPVFAVEEVDPAMAALKRMREQLRTVMLQQQKTEADRAALAAEKVTLEEKASSLDSNLKKLVKESNLQKETDSKAIADLQDKAAQQAAEIVRLQESLAAWKKGHAQIVDAAKKIDAQRAEHAARAILAERKVAEANRKNLDLYNIGNEILAKYEGFGLGTAIAAREPFTKSMRVKLENYLQDFGDKLQDGKIQPADAPKTPDATAVTASKPVSKEEAARVEAPKKQ